MILIIGYLHRCDDKRVLRTVKALSKVDKVIYQFLDLGSKCPEIPNVKLIPVKKETSRNPIRRYSKLLKFDNDIIRIVENSEYDVLYLHGFALSKPPKLFKVASKKGKTVIFDVHEYYPYIDLNLEIPNLEFFRKLRTLLMWKIFKKQIELSDKIVFVSEGVRDEVFEILGFQKPSLIVPNYADLTLEPEKKEKSICFVGGTPRDLSQELEIVDKLVKNGFEFEVIGNIPNKINFPHRKLPVLPYDEMMEEISKCAFSLVSFSFPRTQIKKYEHSLPHKFFDSLAAGTPVIVRREFKTMAKMVEEKKLGVVIDPSNVEGSVEKILRAYENYDSILESVDEHKNEFVWDENKEREFVSFVLEGMGS